MMRRLNKICFATLSPRFTPTVYTIPNKTNVKPKLEIEISVTDDNFRQNFISFNYSVVPDSMIELIFSNKMPKKKNFWFPPNRNLN
jgi:hypothetical protein